MPHPHNSMRENSNASADGEHFEPHEFQRQPTNTEDRHANYGMREMPPEEEMAGPNGTIPSGGLNDLSCWRTKLT